MARDTSSARLRAMGWFATGLAIARFKGLRRALASRQIPRAAPSPKAVLHDAFQRAIEARLLPIAAEVAFFALLSLVPALSILVLTYGLVLDRTSLWDQIAPFIGLLPEMAQEILKDQTARLVQTARSDVSLNLVAGSLMTAWSANAATKALFEAINLLHGQRETRSFMRLNLLSLGTTLGGVIFLVGALVALGILPLIRTYIPEISGLDWALSSLRFPILALLCVVALAWLFRIALIEKIEFRRFLPGATLGVLLWAAISFGFAGYASRLGHYSATYGSLAAVIVFLTWLWLSVAAWLAGAAFNAARQMHL